MLVYKKIENAERANDLSPISVNLDTISRFVLSKYSELFEIGPLQLAIQVVQSCHAGE